jgi:hypothetical protein
MSPLTAGAIALATEPSPNPTEGTLRPGLETWEVSPGLIGFVVTFALAVACVLLFLNMSKHLRQAGHNARQQGLPVPEPEVISFRRAEDGPVAEGAGGSSDTGSTPSSAGGGASPSDAGSSSSSGGSGD